MRAPRYIAVVVFELFGLAACTPESGHHLAAAVEGASAAGASEWGLALDQLDRWEAAIGAAPRCYDELQTAQLRFAYADRETTDALCSDTAGACTRLEQGGPALVVLPLAPELSLVRHELTHWLERCSGRDTTGDPRHLDEPAWVLVY